MCIRDSPGRMEVELVDAVMVTPTIRKLTFRRTDADAFPFFRAGQYVSLQSPVGDSLVSRDVYKRQVLLHSLRCARAFRRLLGSGVDDKRSRAVLRNDAEVTLSRVDLKRFSALRLQRDRRDVYKRQGGSRAPPPCPRSAG